MTLTILLARVEISDHPARDHTALVGIFDNARAIDAAKRLFKQRHKDRRVWWEETVAALNVMTEQPPWSPL